MKQKYRKMTINKIGFSLKKMDNITLFVYDKGNPRLQGPFFSGR
jgi:hypothetical protein